MFFVNLVIQYIRFVHEFPRKLLFYIRERHTENLNILLAEIDKTFRESLKLDATFKITSDYYCLVFHNQYMFYFLYKISVKCFLSDIGVHYHISCRFQVE